MLHVFATIFFSAVLLSAGALLLTGLIDSWQDVRRALGRAPVPVPVRHPVRVRRTHRQPVLLRHPATLRAAA